MRWPWRSAWWVICQSPATGWGNLAFWTGFVTDEIMQLGRMACRIWEMWTWRRAARVAGKDGWVVLGR